MSAKIFRINYKSDFILTLNSDAGWMTPFCIKFWTGAPSQAYFVGWDGETYTHCAYDPTEPTKLLVQFDDHHLPIGDLKFQIAYHFTVADFPDDTEDEVINPASIIVEIDGEQYQVMLDFTGETAPEIAFSLPAYANEAQRIANEQQRIIAEEQRIANEQARIAAEATRQQNEEQRIQQESMRVHVFAQLKQESEQATDDANAAATLANEKAQLAADKAALAQSAATLANQKAQLAADKAALAQQKADYAQTQGSYAKTQGDYAKEQGEIAEEDHERAESDHTRAESDHAAVEVYVDSLGAFDISAYHATGGVLAKYADLTAALGTNGANIPEAIRKGGMSVKFVLSSDNNYVQYRYMLPYAGNTTAENNKFVNPTNWQGVDDVPTANSNNLVKSGGVATKLNHINKEINGIPELNLSYNIENNEAFNVNHDVSILTGVYNLVCDNSVDGRTYLRFYYRNGGYYQVINITDGWSGQVSFTDDVVGVRFQTLDFVSGGVVSLIIVSEENSLTKRISSLESDNTINKNDITDIKNDIDRIDSSISSKDNSKEYSFEITRNELYQSKREIDVKAGKYKLSYTNSVVGTTYVRLFKMDGTYKQYKLTEQGEISLDIAEDYTKCAFQTISFESSGLIILSFDDLEKTDGVTSEIVTELNIKINDALTKCDTLIYDAKLLNDRAYASEYKSGFSLQLDSPKIIFIFDDAVANTSDVLDVFKTKNKIFCEATPSNTLNNVAKDGRTIKNVLLELQNLGGEVISHSINGTPLDTMTYDECENALRKSRIDLENAGFEINGWVSPSNNFASIAERLYPKYYLYGVGAAPSSSRLQNLHFSRTALTTLADAKGMVDWAVSNNSYRIFTSHMRDENLNNFSLSDLATLLDYCDEQDVEIITMKTLYFNYGRNA